MSGPTIGFTISCTNDFDPIRMLCRKVWACEYLSLRDAEFVAFVCFGFNGVCVLSIAYRVNSTVELVCPLKCPVSSVAFSFI